jgi:hypothetical protein
MWAQAIGDCGFTTQHFTRLRSLTGAGCRGSSLCRWRGACFGLSVAPGNDEFQASRQVEPICDRRKVLTRKFGSHEDADVDLMLGTYYVHVQSDALCIPITHILCNN